VSFWDPTRSGQRPVRNRHRFYGTWKGASLESVRLGVTTSTVPLVAPTGTVVVISELETTVKAAGVPLKVTLVAPVRLAELMPKIVTAVPTLPEAGAVSIDGPATVDRLKSWPSVDEPP
jgi:hypothetical protein